MFAKILTFSTQIEIFFDASLDFILTYFVSFDF